MLPIIDNINVKLKKDLLEKNDVIVRKDDDIEKALDLVDQRLLVEALDMNKDVYAICQIVYKKMAQT